MKKSHNIPLTFTIFRFSLQNYNYFFTRASRTFYTLQLTLNSYSGWFTNCFQQALFTNANQMVAHFATTIENLTPRFFLSQYCNWACMIERTADRYKGGSTKFFTLIRGWVKKVNRSVKRGSKKFRHPKKKCPAPPPPPKYFWTLP